MLWYGGIRAGASGASFVAFAVHYTGVVVVHGGTLPPLADHNALTAEQCYATIKANADALKPLQVGLAVGTRDGRCLAWEFNLHGFDHAVNPHDAGYVSCLEEEHGMDLDAHRVRGIPMARLTGALHRSGLVHRLDLPWICHAGAYHLAYLLKVVRGGLPLRTKCAGSSAPCGGDVYDVACVAGGCPFLPVGHGTRRRLVGKPICLPAPAPCWHSKRSRTVGCCMVCRSREKVQGQLVS